MVDAEPRPTRLGERHPVLGVRWRDRFLKVHVTDGAKEMLQRALTRNAIERFNPIAVLSADGRLKDALRVDRLACQLLATSADQA